MEYSKFSVVLQGKILPETVASIQSIRKHLPGCKIILSTWYGSNVNGLNYDELVLNEDPGSPYDCYMDNPSGLSKPNNYNRQVVSTSAGLKVVKTEYVIKFRTDFILYNSNIADLFLSSLNCFDKFDMRFRVFDKRILLFGTGNIHTTKLAYHLADYIQVGTIDDLLNLWTTPLLEAEDANYFKRKNLSLPPLYFNFKIACEQKLWIETLKKNNITFHDINRYDEINDDIIYDSESSLINNFIFIDYYNSGVKSKFNWLADISNDFSYKFGYFIDKYDELFGLADPDRNFIRKYRSLLRVNRNFLLQSAKIRLRRYRYIKYIYSFFLKFFKTNTDCSKIIKNNNKIYHRNENGNLEEVNDIPGFNIRFEGTNNVVEVDSNGLMFGNEIFISGNNNAVTIGKNVHCISNSKFFLGNSYNGRKLLIGENSMIMGARIFVEEDGSTIKIGDNLTCSDEVIIQNSDGHVIYDENRNIINHLSRDVHIGDNVWLGRRCNILKNSVIPNGSIVAFGSLVNKEFLENNVIIAGVPARVVKRKIHWSRDMFNRV